MGKLNIAHHKSYHPYRRDNIARVRADEEAARLGLAAEAGRAQLADSEARMDLLRLRAGAARGRRADGDGADLAVAEARAREEAEPAARPSSLTSGGHINLFEDLETRAAPRKPKPAEPEPGIPLAPSEKDRSPWYSADRAAGEKSPTAPAAARRMRDLARQRAHDPLTSINSQLAARDAGPARAAAWRRPAPRPADQPAAAPADARAAHEAAERARALALVRRKQRERAGSATPSVRGERGGGYGDVFNRREVDEARWQRERGRRGG